MALRFLDVLGPALVVGHAVDAQPDDLAVALRELAFQPGHVAELSGADRREILRMREQDRPAVADPFVEIDAAFGRIGGEIGCVISNVQ